MTRLLCALLVAAPAAALAALPEVPPAFDAFLDAEVAQPLVRTAEGRVSSAEPRLGVPSFYWAARTRREGSSLKDMGLNAEEAARRHLYAHAHLYRQSPGRLAEATLHRLHDTGRGAVIVSFRKEVAGVRVFRDELRVVMDRKLELVALSGYLPPHHEAGLRGEPLAFHLGHGTAVAAALTDLTGMGFESTDLDWDGRVVEGYHHFHLRAGDERKGGLRFSQPARARAVYFTLPEGLVPAFYVELDVGHVRDTDARAAGYVLSAHDGSLLFRKNHTVQDAFAYRVWADENGLPWDGPQGTGLSPHPTGTPNGQTVALVPQNVILLEHGPISTQDPWLPSGATHTQGNAVDAYADLNGPDGFGSGDLRAQVTSPTTFDFTYDLSGTPQGTQTQTLAAVTQLFVANSFFHDWYYDAGFTEPFGTAQQNNYGRGGIGGDSLRVEAQDYSGFDNANMSVQGDGSRPRMQMYIFRGGATQRVYLEPASGQNSNYGAGFAEFSPANFDVTGQAVRPDPVDACAPLTNAAQVAGKIVVIDRGTCTFVSKTRIAEDAGAIGVIIANNQGGGAVTMPGQDPTLTIPTQSVSQNSGNAIKNALANNGPVTVRMLRQTNPDRDGTLDMGIVAHEWGHYISNRLIGDANGLNNQQGVGMGEGWGDFHSLLMIVREEDAAHPANVDWNGVFPVSTFSRTAAPGNGLYYGIRRLPYSTDFTKNALTFKHIQNGVPLPQGVPTAYGTSGNNNAEVHATGEVWASMLWECYAALLRETDRMTFAQAQDRMKRYLVAGYKGTPNSPTFTEARDAILAAVLAEDETDFQLLWEAFARRGMGLGAMSPDRAATNNGPVVEDFSAGNAVALVRAVLDDTEVSCDDDGLLDNGEVGHLTVTVRNAGVGALANVTGTLTSETAGVTFPDGATLSFGHLEPFGQATATVNVALSGMQTAHELRFAITLDDDALPEPFVATVGFRGNANEVAQASAVDDVESENSLWLTAQSGGDGFPGFERQALSATEHQWFGPNVGYPADMVLVSPSVDVVEDEEFILSFRHRYDLEASNEAFYDGAVVELQVAGSGTWMDIGALASPQYDGQLAAGNQNPNPLAGRSAWSGKNPSWPDYDEVRVRMGLDYAGQVVRVRFRLGSDPAVAAHGWEIDDIGFEGILGTPFPRVVPQVDVCGNASPMVDVGADFVVEEGQTATLTALASDADGEPLTFTWSQVDGIPVTLSDDGSGLATFVAPEVSGERTLTFEVAVSDGIVTIRAQQKATVVNANHPPVAKVTAPESVRPGAGVLLDGSESHDPDGDALVSFEWTQVAGPQVTVDGEGAQVTFLAPAVEEATALRFKLVVSDGKRSSEPAEVVIAVEPKDAGTVGCGCMAQASGGGAAGALLPLVLAVGALVRRRRR